MPGIITYNEAKLKHGQILNERIEDAVVKINETIVAKFNESRIVVAIDLSDGIVREAVMALFRSPGDWETAGYTQGHLEIRRRKNGSV